MLMKLFFSSVVVGRQVFLSTDCTILDSVCREAKGGMGIEMLKNAETKWPEAKGRKRSDMKWQRGNCHHSIQCCMCEKMHGYCFCWCCTVLQGSPPMAKEAVWWERGGVGENHHCLFHWSNRPDTAESIRRRWSLLMWISRCVKSQHGEQTGLAERQGEKLQDLECLQTSLLLAKAQAGLTHASVKRQERSRNMTARKVLGWSKRNILFL